MTHGSRTLPAAISGELVALYNAGEWVRLVAAADQVTTRFPGQVFGWRAAGKALLQLRRLPEAIERLSRVVKLAPGEADAYNDLGSALHDLGRVDEALTNYRRAVKLNPRSSEAHSNLGRVLCDLMRHEEAVACCRQAIDLNPASAVAHNNLGSALSGAGRPAEAEACYRRALALMPTYLEALVNLASTLAELGRWAEAKTGYRLAVQVHPGSGIAHNALGRFLSRLCEDDTEAAQSLERAIALNAADPNTYAELGNILMRRRQTGAALVMFRRAQQLQPLITWRANQPIAAFSAVFLDTPMGGSTPVNYLAGKAPYDRHFHCVIPDTPADVDLLRAKADVVFNMISNADDGQETLLLALDLVERIDRPTINHPRLIMNTDRETMARRLSAIPGCVVPKTVRVAGPILAEAALAGRFQDFNPPVLARIAGTHGGDDFDKCDDWAEVADFVAKRPDTNHYLIEYLDYRSDDELFRKYRVIFIDGDILPYHLAIHDDWKVHHFRTDMVNHAWMRLEEERFLQNIGGVFNAAQQDALRAIAQATGLDYGGVDCGLDRDGRIVVFEANASMLVHDEKDAVYTYKNPYVARIRHAFEAMVSRRRLGVERDPVAVVQANASPG